MKKLIIRHKDSILKVHASESNTTVFDSYLVKGFWDMGSIIYYIRTQVPDGYAINERGLHGMIHEWRAHNLLYSLGIMRKRTKSVDLNIEQPWYAKVLYFILSAFYFRFK